MFAVPIILTVRPGTGSVSCFGGLLAAARCKITSGLYFFMAFSIDLRLVISSSLRVGEIIVESSFLISLPKSPDPPVIKILYIILVLLHSSGHPHIYFEFLLSREFPDKGTNYNKASHFLCFPD